MNITRKDIDSLNAVLTVEIEKDDYAGKVDALLANYRKTAAIPGFRKGTVPMSLIKKQYEKGVMLEEVNKLLQENLNKYLQEEKLDILGNPLPKVDQSMNWDADTLKFDFELGLAPVFEVSLDALPAVTHYKIIADAKMLDEQVMRIRKQYGKMVSQPAVVEEADITGTFKNESANIDHSTTFSLDIFKEKSTAEKFIGKKTGDVVTVNTKGLFDDDHKLMDYLKVEHDLVHDIDVDVDFTIAEVTVSEPAELNQELFDKLFGEGKITSEDELKAKIKEDAERQFAQQADQKFINDVTDTLLSSVKFELPGDFLKKWLQTAGETPLSPEDAALEYEKSEKGLRYQLIEGKIMGQYNVQVSFEDLKSYTSNMIKVQMAQFGQMDPSDADVDGIVARVLSNKDEVKRLSEQLVSEKMKQVFTENVKSKTKEVTYDEFIKEMYGE
jgi:trigger factor